MGHCKALLMSQRPNADEHAHPVRANLHDQPVFHKKGVFPMTKDLAWRMSLVFAFTFLSLFFLTPTLFTQLPGWWKGYMPKDKISLGLDLQGGTHLVLEVETQKALEGYLDLIAGDLEETVRSQNIHMKKISREGIDKVQVVLYDKSSAEAVRNLIVKKYPDFEATSTIEKDGFVNMSINLNEKAAQDKKDKSVAQALETIRNRIDQFGVSEPAIQREGINHIVIQLPGIKDANRAIELIGKTARLEFKLVHEGASSEAAPEDTEILMEKRVNSSTGSVTETPLVINKKAIITGDLLTGAQVRIDSQFNKPYVSIDFNSTGARLFDQITATNIGKRFAIILDNTVYSAPVIQERISGGSAQISGSFDEKEAADLAIVLRAGSLPAPVKIIQNVTVGPSLGQDSINKGLLASVVGVALVAVFMMLYYRLSGLVANIGMVLNVVYLLGALAALGATLTLPGIAAIVLLIGMSVDSNVLIFERVKEEIKLGKSAWTSLNAGYDKAFMTIMDSHVTTLITAAVLFQFGTGPVKGFAVSLSLGIIINLFTSLLATKAVFDVVFNRFKVKTLSI